MQPANNFIVLNIREYLENEDKRLGEETLVQLLSEFSCPLNPDVERFLKEQAIDFAKKHQAVTYLVLSLEDAELLGYFSITIKPLVVKSEPFSNTVKRKLARFSEIDKNEQTYWKQLSDKHSFCNIRLAVWWHLWKQIIKRNCFRFMKIMVLSVLIQDKLYRAKQNHMNLCSF